MIAEMDGLRTLHWSTGSVKAVLQRSSLTLDERNLKLPEISKFMELLFRRSNDAPFPRDPKHLLILAKEINARSDPVYDARLNAMASPLNIKLLARALGQTTSQRLKALPARIMRTVTCSKHMPRE